jgi:hypothetical protein
VSWVHRNAPLALLYFELSGAHGQLHFEVRYFSSKIKRQDWVSHVPLTKWAWQPRVRSVGIVSRGRLASRVALNKILDENGVVGTTFGMGEITTTICKVTYSPNEWSQPFAKWPPVHNCPVSVLQVVFKITGTKFPEIASRYGEWQVQENFRVLSTKVKENLYSSGLERSVNLRAFWP